MARKCPVDVFQYLDYRAFLRDYYVAKKAEGRSFSYRAFSMRVGVRSPNHLKRVTEGERNLLPETAERYAEAMGLSGDGKLYFCDLVRFTQAADARERKAAYEKLAGYRRYRTAHRLDIAQAEFHSTWYLPAIYELTLRTDFRRDPKWIARQLVPRIRPSQAARALRTMLELGLLEEEDGKLVQKSPIMTTGAETKGIHIVAYHRAMMELASSALDDIPAEMRDISSVTVCVGADAIEKVKARIQSFRKELMALATETSEGEQVLQLNMQLFPLSTSSRNGKL